MDREKKGIAFYNWWGKGYDYSPVAPWLRLIQRKVVSHISLTETDSSQGSKPIRILDAGVGTGYFLSLFDKENVELYGIDIAQGMLNAAQSRLEKSKKVHLHLASVTKMPFKSNFFDYVVSTEAFHHYKDPHGALKEMYRVLKPQGKILVTDLYLQPLALWKKLFLLEPGYINFYSKKEFYEMLRQHNFKVLTQKKVAGPALMTIGTK